MSSELDRVLAAKNSKEIKKLLSSGDAKGIEKAVLIVNGAITKVELALEKAFEGKPLPAGAKYKNPLDKGIVPTVRDLSQIDLCNVLNYTINKIPDIAKRIPTSADKKDGSSKLADSTKKEARLKTEIEKYLQVIQDKAYEAQKLIDEYYSEFGDMSNPNSRTALLFLCRNLQLVFNISSEKESKFSKDLQKLAPQLTSFFNYTDDVFSYFNRFPDFSNLPENQIVKINSYIQKTRGILIAIQAVDISNPTKLLALGANLLPPKVQQDINNLNKIVKPEKLLPFLKNVQSFCVNIQSQANLLVSMIRKGQGFISTLVSIVQLLQLILNLIIALLTLLPNILTTVGVNIVIQQKGITKLEALLKNILNRLSQLNNIFIRTISVVEYVIAQIDETIRYIRIIILNLESCNSADPQIVKDLKNTVDLLESTKKTLVDFKNNYENKKSADNTTYGDSKNKYSIKIVTEQITDEGISLRRRYGIALDKNGALVASSTPTFASDDSIIISEVKLILVSKKLVNPELSSLSPDSIAIINESLNFLEDGIENTISINEDIFNEGIDISMEGEGVDDPDNENEDIGIGLNAFTNKLSGGKKLRKRVRDKMSAFLPKITTNLPSFRGPNVGTGTSEQSDYSKKLKIKELEERRGELVKQRRRALLAGPAGAAIVAAKSKQIRDVDKQIEDLKK